MTTRPPRSHSPRRSLCLLVVVAALVLAIPGAPAKASSLLTWKPPDHPEFSGYVTLALSDRGNNIDLDDAKDYRLVAPSTPITGHTNIRGGRNIVWIGGQIRIDWQGTAASAVSRRAITFRDNGGETDGRVIHIEGLYADGSDLTEGIDLAVPSAVVQIQNVRIEKLVTRGSDDLNGSGSYSSASHPDLLQPWGGAREIRVDGLTGRSGYQHLWMLADPLRSTDRAYFRRVNTEGISYVGADDGMTYVSHTGWGTSVDWTPQLLLDSGTVWHKSHQSGGTFSDSFASDYTVEIATDALGTYAYYPTTAVNRFGKQLVRNFEDTGSGRTYSGLPPGGDYVRREDVGIDYVSPGYSGSPSGQETEPDAPTTLEFLPAADATIRKDYPSRTYGSSTSLLTDGKPVVHFLMKFAVSGVNGRPVSKAVLRLNAQDGSPRGGDFLRVSDVWSEGTVNWQNAPLATGTPQASLGAVAPGLSYDVDLTSMVKGDGTFALRVTSASRDAAGYSSRETTAAPQLILTVE